MTGDELLVTYEAAARRCQLLAWGGAPSEAVEAVARVADAASEAVLAHAQTLGRLEQALYLGRSQRVAKRLRRLIAELQAEHERLHGPLPRNDVAAASQG
jgi:hypothetical protein